MTLQSFLDKMSGLKISLIVYVYYFESDYHKK